jgi:hypothetical protein
MGTRISKRQALLVGGVVAYIGVVSLIPALAGRNAATDGSDLPVCHTTTACFGESNTTGGTGIHGDSRYGHGVVGTTHADPGGFGPGSSAIYGRDFTPYGFYNTGVTGISSVGTGMYGHSTEGSGVTGSGDPGMAGVGYTTGHGNWAGVLAIGGAPKSACDAGYPCPPALAATSNFAQGSGVKLFEAYDNAGNVLAYVDDSGNMYLTGQLFTSGLCKTGCITTQQRSGKRVVAYTPRQAMPSIEDFGQAQLAGGVAYVRLSADFAATIDRSAPYFVFVTPHGDSRGLFVTDETASGFAVRENGGGRATMTFDYRIVAKPYDANYGRLPSYRPYDLGKVSVGRPKIPQ